jgi:hypothetical protein
MNGDLMRIFLQIGLVVSLPAEAALATPAAQEASNEVAAQSIALLEPAAPDRQGAEPGAGKPSRRWSFSAVGGLGMREVDGRAIGVPYIGFWAAQRRRSNLDLVYELFTLTRSRRTRGPDPLWVNPELNMAGTFTYTVEDVAYGGLMRANYYFLDARVRPYGTIGAGAVIWSRVRSFEHVLWQLPDGPPETDVRRRSEPLTGLLSIAGAGVTIRLADRWSLATEARIPLLPVAPFHISPSAGVILGITYSPRGR